MNHRTHLALLDDDFRRRAAITHCLAGTSVHVEPFEDTAELLRHWPRSGLVLAHDREGLVERLVGHMTDTGEWLPLVAYAENPGTPRVVRAVIGGAIDYLEWPFAAADIQQAIAVAEQSAAVQSNLRLREAMARSRLQKLTRREREVLAGVANGLSNRLIGERLQISPRTVEIHRANMLNKMGAHHTSEAIRIAIEASLVS